MNRKILAGSISAAFLLAAMLTVLHLPGCGGGGGSAPVGTLKVLITDSPAFRDFSSVHIRIDRVVVVPAGKEDAADNDSGLLTIADFTSTGGQDVDILKLHFLQQVLGSAVIPAGTYNQIRLILAPNPSTAPFANYFVLAGSSTQTPLTTPSGQETGEKIVGKFTVTAGVLNTILLDFNPNEAIVKRGASGEDNLKPTGIHIIQLIDNAGSISGTIRSPLFKPWSSATVSVVPRNPAGGAVVSGTVFSNFSSPSVYKAPFTAYVPSNGSPAMPSTNYKVFVQAFRDTKSLIPTFNLYSSPAFIVTAGDNTPVPPNGIVELGP